MWAADAVGGEKRAGVRGCDLGGAETLAWMGRNGGAPRQFVRKTDVFPTQCVLTSGIVHQRSSHFSGPLLRSQFLPSFSMPAAPQVRSHARSDGGDGGKASGSARRRIGVSMWGWEDGWKGVWIRQEGGSV